jgi:hypothetical protein
MRDRPCLYVVARAGRLDELAPDSMLCAGVVCDSESELRFCGGSADTYASRFPFIASFAITDVRLIVPLMYSVPGTRK